MTRKIKDMPREEQKAAFANMSTHKAGRPQRSQYQPPKVHYTPETHQATKAGTPQSSTYTPPEPEIDIAEIDAYLYPNGEPPVEEEVEAEIQKRKAESLINQENKKKENKWRYIDKPQDLKGKKFYTSWGYDQTNYDYLIVEDISKSGKTATCRMTSHDDKGYTGQCYIQQPNENAFGKPFKMKIESVYDEDIGKNIYKLRGSYPFIDGDISKGKRLDTFWIAAEDETFYETDPIFGH